MSDSPQNRPPNPVEQSSPKFQTDENFIPLGFSSPINQKQPQSTPSDHGSGGSYRKTGGLLSDNRRPPQRNNFYRMPAPNNRRSYDNRSEQSHYQQNYRRQPHNHHHNQRQKNQEAQHYFHPSMLEDPWKELIAKSQAQKCNESGKPEKCEGDGESDSADETPGTSEI